MNRELFNYMEKEIENDVKRNTKEAVDEINKVYASKKYILSDAAQNDRHKEKDQQDRLKAIEKLRNEERQKVAAQSYKDYGGRDNAIKLMEANEKEVSQRFKMASTVQANENKQNQLTKEQRLEAKRKEMRQRFNMAAPDHTRKL